MILLAYTPYDISLFTFLVNCFNKLILVAFLCLITNHNIHNFLVITSANYDSIFG